MKEKLKKVMWFFANPRLLLCLGVAWMMTNGWSYVLFAIGSFFGIAWMSAVAGAYLTFLWFPFTPEKIVTVIIAIALLKFLFPEDQKTLAILEQMYNKIKSGIKERKQNKNKNKGKNQDKSEE